MKGEMRGKRKIAFGDQLSAISFQPCKFRLLIESLTDSPVFASRYSPTAFQSDR